MRRRAAVLNLAAATAVAGLMLAGCGGTGSSLPPCVSPPPGIGPNAAGTLQLEDKGKTICLKVGDELTVFLAVPITEESTRWGSIETSDASVLEALNSGILTLVRGVTGAVYQAHTRGVAQLTSVRPPCEGLPANCSPDQVWQATIVVH